MTHLSDEFMLDMLSKVQPLQVEIIKTGRSAHLDGHVHEDIFAYGRTHISFELTVFEETTLVESFDFNSSETEEQVEAVLATLVAYVNSL